MPISALFNALTVHIGDTELLRLPGWLPLLGGPVTLEALGRKAEGTIGTFYDSNTCITTFQLL